VYPTLHNLVNVASPQGGHDFNATCSEAIEVLWINPRKVLLVMEYPNEKDLSGNGLRVCNSLWVF
jgi:hypothetical protein